MGYERAIFGRDVGAAIAASLYTQSQVDLAAVQQGVFAGNSYLVAGEYANAVQAYQAVGLSGATVVGPEIDLAGAPNITQPYTQKAWAINAALAAVNQATATLADAQRAQALIGQMVVLYQQAIAAGTAGAGPGPSGGPDTSTNAAVYFWAIGLGAVAGTGWGLYRHFKRAA
ncbi:MAG: hypothetical protein ACYDDA_04735 [Acidiferrobacteraceae bacterium]